ncbi:MAG: ABC transporter substrate-binding protein [Alphaproteobacteria bacterium]|nr:MAG: ABC transporter substrate-binding protein [Alphaproteobacteria bacterium]
MRKITLICLTLLLSFAFIPTTSASAGGAEGFVKNLSDTAISTLTGKNMDQTERDRRFRVLLNQNFDVPGIGRFALGRYWKSASTDQQQEYLRLFESMLTQTYSARFAKYSGQTVKVNGSKQEVDSILVQSQMINPDGSKPVLIDWRLKQAGNGFKIMDLIVEGVSMSTTQRSEFSSVIERGGGDIDALIKILRKKTQGRADNGQVTAHTD